MAFYGYTGASRAGHCGGGVGQRHGPDTPQWVPFPMPPVLRSQQGIGADKGECAGAAREGGRGDVIAFELDTDRGTFHAWKEGVLCFSHIRALEGELHFCIVNARMTEYFAKVLRYISGRRLRAFVELYDAGSSAKLLAGGQAVGPSGVEIRERKARARAWRRGEEDQQRE